nr:phosphoribosyltransferase family protein [Mycoplasmopsis bovis]
MLKNIIDSGITLNKVKEILETRNPKSIRILTLLDKPYRRKVALNADMFEVFMLRMNF